MSEPSSQNVPLLSAPVRFGFAAVIRVGGRSFLPAFILSLAGALACRYAAGANLGMFLGSLVAVAMLAPPLALTERQWSGRLIAFPGLVAGPAFVWLISLSAAEVPLLDWVRFTLVLAAFVAALMGLAMLLGRVGLAAAIASAMVVVLALAWLSWPVWTAPWLSGRQAESLVAALVAPHPLFAINGGAQGPFPRPWAQYRYAYRLTTLGDHLNYEPPSSIASCVLVHFALAGACLGVMGALDWRHRRQAAYCANESTGRLMNQTATNPASASSR